MCQTKNNRTDQYIDEEGRCNCVCHGTIEGVGPVLHCMPCCGYCPHCKKDRIKHIFAHMESCEHNPANKTQETESGIVLGFGPTYQTCQYCGQTGITQADASNHFMSCNKICKCDGNPRNPDKTCCKTCPHCNLESIISSDYDDHLARCIFNPANDK